MSKNYRGIILLCTTLKLTTKIITNKINKRISLADEQQGFRSEGGFARMPSLSQNK